MPYFAKEKVRYKPLKSVGGRMSKYTIAFDVDGTLIDQTGKADKKIIELLKSLASLKNTKIVVWSGRGRDYAKEKVEALELSKEVKACYGKAEMPRVDIAFDNEDDFDLADKNLIVKSLGL